MSISHIQPRLTVTLQHCDNNKRDLKSESKEVMMASMSQRRYKRYCIAAELGNLLLFCTATV